MPNDKKILEKFKGLNPCVECPYNTTNPEESCTADLCLTYHLVLGYKMGYSQALEDLKAPKTLAENRED